MDLEEFRETQKKMWSSGDYRPIGRVLQPAAQALVENAGVGPNSRVLDIGVGSGNVAVAAARKGADVVGVDITDAWWDEAYRQADEAGVELDLRLGDAEELPFEDEEFDYVLSSFAAVFAPRHQVVAAELTRVARPGGTIALNAWPPDGTNQLPMRPLLDRLPEEEGLGGRHTDWGLRDHVRELFQPHPVTLIFKRPTFMIRFASERAFQELLFEHGAGFMAIKQALEERGLWEEACAEMHQVLVESNKSTDGTFSTDWEYLQTIGKKSPA